MGEKSILQEWHEQHLAADFLSRAARHVANDREAWLAEWKRKGCRVLKEEERVHLESLRDAEKTLTNAQHDIDKEQRI